MRRSFESLSPERVLALAIGVEQANARRFRAFAEVFEGYDQGIARRFRELAAEEDEHEAILANRFRARFGETIPVVDEIEVEGVIESVDLDDAEHLVFDSLRLDDVYKLAHRAEVGAQAFYRKVAAISEDAELKRLYTELAEMEDDHAGWLEEKMKGQQRTGGDS